MKKETGGNQPSMEPAQATSASAAKDSSPSNSATCDDHAITVPPSVEEQEARKALVEWLSSAVSPFIYDRSQFYDEFWSRLNRLIAAVRSAQPPSQDDEPEIIERKGLNPLQSLYDDPKWVANYFAGLEGELARLPRRTLARMIVDKLKSQPPSQARQETDQEHDLGAVSATEVDAISCSVHAGQRPHDGSGEN